VYIAKDRTGKPEKKKGPEPKSYGALQKVMDKIDHQEKAYAEFKGKSFSERYICVCSCIISCTRNLFYLCYWKNVLLLSGGFSIGDSYLLIDCKY
jgi:hypothetical protein